MNINEEQNYTVNINRIYKYINRELTKSRKSFREIESISLREGGNNKLKIIKNNEIIKLIDELLVLNVKTILIHNNLDNNTNSMSNEDIDTHFNTYELKTKILRSKKHLFYNFLINNKV